MATRASTFVRRTYMSRGRLRMGGDECHFSTSPTVITVRPATSWISIRSLHGYRRKGEAGRITRNCRDVMVVPDTNVVACARFYVSADNVRPRRRDNVITTGG